MIRTLVPVRTADTVVYVDALASVKVGPFTFLVHRSENADGRFLGYLATYAPIGLRAGDPRESVQEVIDKLASVDTDLVSRAIARTLEDMRSRYMCELAPEEGLQRDVSWQEREQYRFDSGEYSPVPSILGLQYPQEHYVHLSVTKTESDFVAYTPSEDYGTRDRQVRMKFGKYLRKCFPEMPDTEVQAAVMALRSHLALVDSPATLLFATDWETINDIFETAMCACDSTYTSCMHGKFNEDDIRPYHVYADSPDVAVAYVRESGAIVSRTVVSTKDYVWVRLYSVGGCSTKCGVLKDLLNAAGYSHGDLTGNRLTKLQTRRVMLPYIDHGGMGVIDQGKYWEVCAEGEGDYTADQTDGSASENENTCSRCEHDEDDCQCSYCECCEESYYPSCDRCSFCEECEGCREHCNCSCARCSYCDNIIEPSSRYTDRCRCERCDECSELISDCQCDHCEKCEMLTSQCECETEEIEKTETEEATV